MVMESNCKTRCACARGVCAVSSIGTLEYVIAASVGGTQGAADWILGSFELLNIEEQLRFLTICWAIWHNRNKMVMESKLQDSLCVVQEAFVRLHQ
ncbi:UNVERIFIED_CONTAM: hypothetical protein Slati_2254200 [Sesamum latifolium]|uniref:Uncharacterized protein n=1 Tax=Sesamum latifolium TaxID=2727402 RepID=A0AAW2WUP0_9LAMI